MAAGCMVRPRVLLPPLLGKVGCKGPLQPSLQEILWFRAGTGLFLMPPARPRTRKAECLSKLGLAAGARWGGGGWIRPGCHQGKQLEDVTTHLGGFACGRDLIIYFYYRY